MILNVIGIMILCFSFINYKKGFMLFLLYQLFWYYGATFFTVGTKIITISMFLNIAFFILFFVKGNIKYRAKKRFPFSFPFLCIMLSYLISCFCSVGGFLPELTRSISSVSNELITVWLAWYVIDSKADFSFIFKGVTIIMLAACLFGLLEYATHTNFLIDIKNTVASSEIETYNSIQSATAQSRGYRITSIFEHSIGAGMNFAMYSVFVLYLYVNRRITITKNYLAIITAALCVPCLLLTKMRSPLLFAVILIFVCVEIKKKNFYRVLGLSIIVLIVAFPYYQDYLNLFLSLFSEKYASGVKGSSFEQRLEQLNAAYMLMRMSPIGGLGSLAKDLITNAYTKSLLAYESIWFGEMVFRGIAGILANISLMVYSIFIVPKKYHSKPVAIFCVAYWITYTLTSIPGFRTQFFYLVVFYFIKFSKNYINAEPEKYKFIKVKINR